MFTLQDMTTRELLNARNLTRGRYRDDDEDDDEEHVLVGTRRAPGGIEFSVTATRDEIRDALHSREHVPSKVEATVIRRLKAKTKQSEEWLRAHPKYGQEIANAGNSTRQVVSSGRYQRLTKIYGKQLTAKQYKIVVPSKGT